MGNPLLITYGNSVTTQYQFYPENNRLFSITRKMQLQIYLLYNPLQYNNLLQKQTVQKNGHFPLGTLTGTIKYRLKMTLFYWSALRAKNATAFFGITTNSPSAGGLMNLA